MFVRFFFKKTQLVKKNSDGENEISL